MKINFTRHLPKRCAIRHCARQTTRLENAHAHPAACPKQSRSALPNSKRSDRHVRGFPKRQTRPANNSRSPHNQSREKRKHQALRPTTHPQTAARLQDRIGTFAVFRNGKRGLQITLVVLIINRGRNVNTKHFVQQLIRKLPRVFSRVIDLTPLLEIRLSTFGRQVGRDLVQAKRARARNDRLRRINVTEKLSRQRHLSRHLRQELALFVFQRLDRCFHRRAHRLKTIAAKHARLREITKRGRLIPIHRNSKHIVSRDVSGQRRVYTMDQAIDETEPRRIVRLVTQQPLHAAAVETMRRGNAISVARKDNVEWIASSSRAFEFKFVMTARRFDYQHYRRQRIFHQRIDRRTGALAYPVDPRACTKTSQDRGFEVRQAAPHVRKFRLNVARLADINIGQALADSHLFQDAIDDLFRREQVTSESEFAVAAREGNEVVNGGDVDVVPVHLAMHAIESRELVLKLADEATQLSGRVALFQNVCS